MAPNWKIQLKSPFFDQFLHVRCQIISIFHQKVESGLKMTKFYTKNAEIHILSLEIMIFKIYWFLKYFRFFLSFSCSFRFRAPVYDDGLKKKIFWVLKLLCSPFGTRVMTKNISQEYHINYQIWHCDILLRIKDIDESPIRKHPSYVWNGLCHSFRGSKMTFLGQNQGFLARKWVFGYFYPQ